MSTEPLTQAEADALLAMAKHRADTVEYIYPQAGGSLIMPLVSEDGHEQFLLDINRGRINLDKVTYQNRARLIIPLARLDLNGSPHRNPDGEEVACPHLHLYREGFWDKWAFPVPAVAFSDVGNLWRTLEDFMRFCNIVKPPHIRAGMFA